MAKSQYIGRFAPSPTGFLHLGSLTGALASYLDAKAHSGTWLLRIEDIDPPREIEGASQSIIESLEQHGLIWDGDILYQSQRLDAYQQALDTLTEKGLTFLCNCSRQQVRAAGGVYPGTCRDLHITNQKNHATRVRTTDSTFTLQDCFQPPISWNLASDIGDFIIRRKDGLFAYQLAVVVDDIYQGVNHVIRGLDLLDSTPMQWYLYTLLDKTLPTFGHTPLVLNNADDKLSKQTKAPALEAAYWRENLLNALAALGQQLPPPAQQDSPNAILQWAITHWSASGVSQHKQIRQDALPFPDISN